MHFILDMLVLLQMFPGYEACREILILVFFFNIYQFLFDILPQRFLITRFNTIYIPDILIHPTYHVTLSF